MTPSCYSVKCDTDVVYDHADTADDAYDHADIADDVDWFNGILIAK